MKYSILLLTVISIFILTSCGQYDSRRSKIKTTNAPLFSVPNAAPVNNPATPVTNPNAITMQERRLNPAHGQPGHRCDIAVGAPLPATTGTLPVLNNPAVTPVQNASTFTPPVTQPQTAITTTVAKGMNPPHGQPGHRCDIPVGQPLSSAPVKPQATTTTPSIITPTADNTPDTLFAKGLNPAHGKPGHRCDIAVGQPLPNTQKTDTPIIKSN